MPPTIVPPPAPIYSNLDSRLAQQYASLPDLYQRRQPSIAPVPAPQLAPAFVPAPAPAWFSNIPDLAQRYAALPPLIERGRGRGRGNPSLIDHGQGRGNPPLIDHGRGRVNPPLSYEELAAQYAALPPVCLMFYFILESGIKLIFVHHIRLILYLDILHHLDLQLPLCHIQNSLLNMLLFLLYVLCFI